MLKVSSECFQVNHNYVYSNKLKVLQIPNSHKVTECILVFHLFSKIFKNLPNRWSYVFPRFQILSSNSKHQTPPSLVSTDKMLGGTSNAKVCWWKVEEELAPAGPLKKGTPECPGVPFIFAQLAPAHHRG